MGLIISILAYGARWSIETVFLLLALCVIARIQKLQFTVGGLAVSAAIACALDLIPFVGHFLALPVLWVCLTKVTREDFTGVVFTAAISYALVFGMNLFLLSALMGDLRVSARERAPTGQGLVSGTDLENGSEDALGSDFEADDSKGSADAALPTARVQAPIQTRATQAKPARVQPKAAEVSPPAANPSTKSPLARAFSLKAVTLNGKASTALIFTGVRTYEIGLGESRFVQTPQGVKSVRLEKCESDSAVLDLAGEKVKVVQALPQ